jgi:hypothetical protein
LDVEAAGSVLVLALALVVVTTVLTLAAAAPAAAEWSKPFAISSSTAPYTFGYGPALGVAPDGSFLAVWLHSLPGKQSNGFIEARRIDANGNLGPVLTLTSTNGDVRIPRIAISPDADAIVIWKRITPQHSAIEARRLHADGTLGPVITVSEPGDREVVSALAVDSHGNATVAWANQVFDSSVLKVRRISATDELGPVHTLTKTIDGLIGGVATAVGPDNRPLIVYDQFGQIRAQRLSASGDPLPGVMQLSATDDTSSFPQALSDASSVVRVIWGRSDPMPQAVSTRTVEPDGTLGATEGVTDASDPSLALDSAGVASIASVRTTDSLSHVLGSTISPDSGSLGAFTLSAPSLSGDMGPQVGIDAQGASVAVWQRNLGRDGSVAEAARFSDSGLLDGARALSQPSQLAPTPHVAVNPAGRALVAWWQGAPDSTTVRAKAALFVPPAHEPPPSAPHAPRCHGRRATVVGTRHDNHLVGTARKDVIVGRRGDDEIFGRAGRDVICGSAGMDLLRGNRGKDRVFGGRGKDDVRG